MANLYSENTANYPRLKTDVLFVDYNNTYKYEGSIEDAIEFINKNQLKRPDLWGRFVKQFTFPADNDGGWKGEFWGKMMRGACFVYSYTREKELYDMLKDSVGNMMAAADEDGRISAYPKDNEFRGWDMWCRKYVLLGMQYFMEVCDDEEFNAKIVESMKGQVDYIISKIGPESEGKLPINDTSNYWRGLNSSSILEPIVRLYTLTGEKRYLDFAEYIINEGGTAVANIFELAYEDNIAPYQYPITKAYEMISCFEGVLEYYRVTGNEKYKTAVVNFANRLLETDFTVVGSGGCTHELFDHSTVRQTNTTNGPIAQETCVTVTYMKFFYQLLLLTGEAKWADAYERSLYNAYLGAINVELVNDPQIIAEHPDWYLEPLPFDSYSPITPGRRGMRVGGLQGMNDKHYYGCCACIGSAGIGLVHKIQLLTSEKGIAVSLYIKGEAKTLTPSGKTLTVVTDTEYPADGSVKMTVGLEAPETFEIKVRNPEWSKTTAIKVNGEAINVNDGYVSIVREWKDGDVISVELDMRTVLIRPVAYEPQMIMTNVLWGYNYVTAKYDAQDPIAMEHYAFRRGPIVLAQDNRLGIDVSGSVDYDVTNDYVDAAVTDDAPYKNMVAVTVPLRDGSRMTLTDYASAGKLYNGESAMAAWIRVKK
jgi:DUF1680 family protein